MKTVSFVNMKGGVAKTTLAVNIADFLNRREGKRILLVDLDPQFNATQCLFSGNDYVKYRESGGRTVLDIFDDTQPTRIGPVDGHSKREPTNLEDIKPWPVRDGFDMIPGDLELYRLDMAAGQGREQRLKRYLTGYRENNTYDIVIIDTPPTPSHWMMSGLIASDAYLVPVKPEPLSRVGIDLLRGVIGRCADNFGHDIFCSGVVLTIVDRRTVVFRDAVKYLDNNELWKGKRYAADFPQRTGIARAQGSQRLILDTPEVDAKTSLARITSEFLQRIEHGRRTERTKTPPRIKKK